MNAIDIFLLAAIIICLFLAWRFRKSGRCCGDCEKCQKNHNCISHKKQDDSGENGDSQN